ncbi:MAG: AAA family ATPase [Micropruina sp.]|uniref:AAA family ATPase n=1 Tax=Micropruina sp. TaxID=2737536 RepID=UPI0039E57A60
MAYLLRDDDQRLTSAGVSTMRDADAGESPRPRRSDLIVVGGVPGAGKSTAIARAAAGLGHVSVIDPEQVIQWLRRRLPASVPYRNYRWLIHTTHTIRVVASLLSGPITGHRLVIHDPGTRVRRRQFLLALAGWAGWRVTLLFVDVDHDSAREGQYRRGRVVASFEDHWRSWERLKPVLTEMSLGRAGLPAGVDAMLLVDRSQAADVLRHRLSSEGQAWSR